MLYILKGRKAEEKNTMLKKQKNRQLRLRKKSAKIQKKIFLREKKSVSWS